jgi:hypothetical protein
MARQQAPDRSRMAPDGPSDVRVTITVRPRPSDHRHHPRLAAGAVLAIAAFAVILALAVPRPPHNPAPRCASVTVSASNVAYASVNVQHRAGCARRDEGVQTRGLLAPDESR